MTSGLAPQVSYRSEQMTDHARHYAFPHAGANERRRLELFAERLDPLTVRRIQAFGLAPGGWLLAEDCDFGLWLADFDPIWAAHPSAWHEAFPTGSLAQGRALLRQIHQLGLEDIGADADLDIVQPGTALAEFYQLSIAAMAGPLISSGVMTAAEEARLEARLDDPDFLGCGFAFIGAWGRRPAGSLG